MVELREEFPWVRTDSTALVRGSDGEVRWWTFAGGVANTILAHQLKRWGETKADNVSISIEGEAAHRRGRTPIWLALAPQEIFPRPDPRAIANLKFSEALPRPLADGAFCARFKDDEGIDECPGGTDPECLRRVRLCSMSDGSRTGGFLLANQDMDSMMLDERIKSRILDDHKKLVADGKLLSSSQLEGYYRTFRSRFGPDVLAKLDGEELLETMHSLGNKDSLVYWLEFKNDEEFPARIFGSIAGGSAFKFGVFRRKETGTWVTSRRGEQLQTSPSARRSIIARKHRDQLLRGVEHLRQTTHGRGRRRLQAAARATRQGSPPT